MEHSTVEPTMQDIHNLVTRIRNDSYEQPTIEGRIESILEDFAGNPGNATRVYSNDEVLL